MHCHIELHNLDGMQMLLNESFSEVPAAPLGMPLCHSYPPSQFREQQRHEKPENGRYDIQ